MYNAVATEYWTGPQAPPVQLDRRLQRTRGALMDALLFLLKQKSFDQISIREITATASIGYATFYRHYATKERLLQDVAVVEVKKSIEAALPVVFIANMRESVRVLCLRIMERPELWRAFLKGGASGILREEFASQTRRLRKRLDGFEQSLPDELYLICSTGVTIDVLTWWLSQKRMASVDEVADILDRLIAAINGCDGQAATPEGSQIAEEHGAELPGSMGKRFRSV